MSVIAGFMVPHPPLIVPQVGRGGEKQIEETTRAYENVAQQVARLKPDTIIISTPHAIMYSDYFSISPGKGAKGSFVRFGAPQVRFEVSYDADFVYALEKNASNEGIYAGTLGEREKDLDHGVMVPLYFINKVYEDYKLVRVSLSGLDLAEHYRLGRLIQKTSESLGRRSVYIASGDLSHKLKAEGPYGFAKEGPEYDERLMDVCKRGAFGELFDFEEDFCEKAAECGHRSFVMMAGAFDGRAVESEILSHQDVTGVGYGIGSFYPAGRDESRCFLDRYLEKKRQELTEKRSGEDSYVSLARRSVESIVRTGKVMDIPGDVDRDLLSKRAGAFVSIHKNGRLRGCIGTIGPVRDTLASEIIHNAVSAATEDPRFSPIEPGELELLDIKVDELMPPEDIKSPEELDVKRYGVIVSCGMRRGLLLPDLPGVDTVEEQIDIARQKGGIAKGEKYSLKRFEVIRHI